LKTLLDVIEKQVAKRFYSSSLLFLYEGEWGSDNLDPQIDVRMIDFAHTFPREPEEPNDDGYIFGLKNLINILETIHTQSMNSNSETTSTPTIPPTQ